MLQEMNELKGAYMDKVRVILTGVLALCGVTGFATVASADSPCPAQVEFFQTLYIDNGFGNWPYQEWVEFSELYLTEGSSETARCYYVGTLFSSHGDIELVDPDYHWSADLLSLALQASRPCVVCEGN